MRNRNNKNNKSDSNESMWTKFIKRSVTIDGVDSIVYIVPESSTAKFEQKMNRCTNKEAFDKIIGNPPHSDIIAKKAEKNNHFRKLAKKMHDLIAQAFTPEPVIDMLLERIDSNNLLMLAPRFGKTNLHKIMKSKGYTLQETIKVSDVFFDQYTKEG